MIFYFSVYQNNNILILKTKRSRILYTGIKAKSPFFILVQLFEKTSNAWPSVFLVDNMEYKLRLSFSKRLPYIFIKCINISGILWQMSQRCQILRALLVPTSDDELHYQQPGERPCLALACIANLTIWADTCLWTGAFLSGGSILSTITAPCHPGR